MKISDIPYIQRPELEKQLRDFLLANLASKSGNPKALLLIGETGVGKKTLINQVLEKNQELQKYSCLDIDMKSGEINDLRHSKSFQNKLYDIAVDFSKESLPFPLNPMLGQLLLF